MANANAFTKYLADQPCAIPNPIKYSDIPYFDATPWVVNDDEEDTDNDEGDTDSDIEIDWDAFHQNSVLLYGRSSECPSCFHKLISTIGCDNDYLCRSCKKITIKND